MRYALINADIITPFRQVERGIVLVEDGTIAAIGGPRDFPVPSDIKVFDLDGKILTPGFIDLLVHGGGGFGFADADPDAVEKISEYFFAHGTTGMLGALFSKPEAEMVADVRRLASYAEKTKGKGNLWGLHLEGPFINPDLHGAMKKEYLWNANLDGWNKLHDAGRGYIRLMTIAPELPDMAPIMRAAARAGVVLSIGHSTASYEDVLFAIDNGVAHVTHMFNAMRPFHHRRPGVVLSAMLHNELKIELIADGIHVHPAVMKLLVNVKGSGGIILVTDAIRASGMPEGTYQFMDQLITMKDRRAYLADETLAGSTLTMNRAVKTMVEKVDVPLTEAVRMASLNGAKVLGVEHQKGIIAVGKDADLVVMDREFEVHMTICEGEIRYQR